MSTTAESSVATPFHRITAPSGDEPYIAFCWATGKIEFGAAVPKGAIEIVRGEKSAVLREMAIAARHGKGYSADVLLVPGVPEAKSQRAAGDALEAWMRWRAENSRPGLTWNLPKTADRRS